MAVRRINGRSVGVVGVINGGTPTVATISGLSAPAHDYVELAYSGGNLAQIVRVI